MASLLLRFILFYAVLALFLSVFAQWSGAGQSVDGWNAFTSTLSGGPLGPLGSLATPPTPPVFYDRLFSTFYLRNVSASVACPLDHIEPADILDTKPENAASSRTLLPGQNPNNASYGAIWAFVVPQDLIVLGGTWTTTIYVNVTPAPGPAPILFIRGAVFWPNLGAGTCGSGAQFLFSEGVNVTRAGNETITIEGHNIAQFNVTSGTVLSVGVTQATGNQTIKVLMSAARESRVDSPGFIDWTSETDALKIIAFYFIGFIRSFIYVVQVVVYLIIAIASSIFWFLSTVILFFGGLFALSFAGVFGPFGAVVSIVNVVFLSFLVVTVATFVRGTGIANVAGVGA